MSSQSLKLQIYKYKYKDFYRNFDLVKEKWKLILHIFYYLQNLEQKGIIHLH